MDIFEIRNVSNYIWIAKPTNFSLHCAIRPFGHIIQCSKKQKQHNSDNIIKFQDRQRWFPKYSTKQNDFISLQSRHIIRRTVHFGACKPLVCRVLHTIRIAHRPDLALPEERAMSHLWDGSDQGHPPSNCLVSEHYRTFALRESHRRHDVPFEGEVRCRLQEALQVLGEDRRWRRRRRRTKRVSGSEGHPQTWLPQVIVFYGDFVRKYRLRKCSIKFNDPFKIVFRRNFNEKGFGRIQPVEKLCGCHAFSNVI